MKENLRKISEKFAPVFALLKKYQVIIFIILISLIYGFLFLKINSLNSQEPSDNAVTSKLQSVARPKIDQSAIDKIQQLQDNSSQVKALFNNARRNPFVE